MKTIKETYQSKRTRAVKYVKNIKVWYWSFPMYLIGSGVMVGLVYLMKNDGTPNFVLYILLIGPLLWWIYFIIQGLSLFLPKLGMIRKWEERQIEKYIKQENTSSNANN